MMEYHKRMTIACLWLVLCNSSALAQTRLQLSVEAGYTTSSSFNWSIAGNIYGQSPNVYSELKWKGLKGPSTGVSGWWNAWKGLGLEGAYSRTFINSGSVSDIDYQENNREDPSYHGYFNSNQGSETAWLAGVGYQVMDKGSINLRLVAGYAGSRQSLYLLDDDPSLGGILHSSYQTKWNGPAAKIKIGFKITKGLWLESDATYCQVNYHSKADWNLIQTFRQPDSYNDRAKGYGLDLSGRLNYRLTRVVGLGAGIRYGQWKTGTGIDDLYLAAGGMEETRMNGVLYNVLGYLVNVEIYFR